MALFAGIALVQSASLKIAPMALTYVSGILIGDLGCYFLGHYFWKNKIKYSLKKNIKKNNSMNSFPLLLFFARFTPLIKGPVFIYCGWARYSLIRYIFWLLFLSIVQIGLVSLMLFYSPDMPVNTSHLMLRSLLIFLIFFTIAQFIVFVVRYRANSGLHFKKNIYRLLRFHNRQFWPLWFLYIPLYFYLLVLALKYRSLWAWLYVNPSLPNGGWWAEKKSELDVIIKKQFKNEYLIGKLIKPKEFLELNEKERLIFLSPLSFPFVAKPDQGKQGQGVEVLSSMIEFNLYLSQCDEDIFVQEYDKSPFEAGLMFYRDLSSQKIHFFSMTDKFFPQIYGDGKSTVLELMLKDLRAKFIASTYIDQLQISENTVLEDLMPMNLTKLGNHSKGALFFSDHTLMTEPLLLRLNETLGQLQGIDFGRLDIKYSSRESLQNGIFKIMELNGAGAESTHIHDPRWSLFELYKILFKQWDLLFQLGLPHEKSFYESIKKLKTML